MVGGRVGHVVHPVAGPRHERLHLAPGADQQAHPAELHPELVTHLHALLAHGHGPGGDRPLGRAHPPGAQVTAGGEVGLVEAARGAEVVIEPSDGGAITPELIARMRERAHAAAETPGSHYAD